MGEHGGRYQHIGDALAARGVEVFLPDLRGFGHSGGARGSVRHYTDYHRDLAVLHHFAARENLRRPFFFLGHSFGGLLTSSYIALAKPDGPVSGLILSSPLFGIQIPVSRPLHWMAMAAATVAPEWTRPNGVTPAALTHDQAILEAYGRDPLLFHRISMALYREMTRLIARRQEIASALTVPVLLLQAGDDRIVSKAASLAFFDAIGTADKTLQVYPGLLHEILNETSRQAIFNLMTDWVEEHLS